MSGMSYFAQAPPYRPCYVHLDAQQRPLSMVGGIRVSDTADRDNPPAPICGLNIDNTPLGRGHIMALQLGGPDVPENIVPQYQQWQQTGAWRQMEVSAMHSAPVNGVFACLMEYANTGDANANGLYNTFWNVDPLVYWDDLRIPTRFRIWLLAGANNPGAQLLAGILAGGLTDLVRSTAAGNLLTTLGTTPAFSEFTVTTMPVEDRTFWMRNQLAMVVDESFEAYQGHYSTLDAPPSPHRETEVEYVFGRGQEVRTRLRDNYGWLDHEINSYASNGQLLEASFHERPLKARTLKNIERREKAYTAKQAKWGKSKPSVNEMRLARLRRGDPY